MSTPIQTPLPSPNEEYDEFPLYAEHDTIPSSLHPPVIEHRVISHPFPQETSHADPVAEFAGEPETGPTPAPVTQPLATSEAELPRIRSPRVRFHSITRSLSDRYHHIHDGNHRGPSDRSDPAQRPLLPSPADLSDTTLSGIVTHQLQLTPALQVLHAAVRHRRTISPQIQRSKHTMSQLIRQKTTRLTERLGRPSDEGEALNASILPEDMGIPLEEVQARRARRAADRLRMLEGGEEPHEPPPSAEAHRLVRSITQAQDNQALRKRRPRGAYQRSGQSTPEGVLKGFAARRRSSGGFGGGGILAQLLKLQAVQSASSRPESVITDDSDSDAQLSSGATTPRKVNSQSPSMSLSMPNSGSATPRKEKLKWYKKSPHLSTASLVDASMNLSRASLPAGTAESLYQNKKQRKNKRRTRLEDEIRVTVHIAEILARQRYIMQLCRALMRYGAPTHRLEEYMSMTARVLEVSGQFLYLPGCMIMSFDDPTTRTAEVKLVRMTQGIDLGRLADTHNVYKNVVHDLIGVEEATQELDEIMSRKPRFNKWILVLMYGFASATVGPFAFGARPIDMPMIFCLGCLVGLMQHVLAPPSALYSNVFEVTAAVLTSFLARALGSITITRNGAPEQLFCFSALAQSSIALILPGFMVLCSSLELQSHQMIAGSIRMVYAIIYSLFLGYGITVGTTIYGLMDRNATSATTCANLDIYGSSFARQFPFVAIYAIFLAIVNHGKWKQMPVMVVIALSGYVTNYFSTTKFGRSRSRIWHGHAATAILPGIFVLVPSGLASSGSLIAGIQYADSVRYNLHTHGNSTSTSSLTDTSVASLGFGMIQVAIGITVGLFIAALVVYPFGKKRTGLFSF
ncbi:Pheromone-regulated membrane protein 10 [Penicillium oxalicum]|uniref:Pheromone-regulated membrane protein 10 n=1 Tax=Penicillium oxalicum TaxID=69781 RepID=UPI0020B840D9|nr:Pheromone-regulated membrane protein 10 [Penicillium oxalicum]KAI2788010.1 Pheromone-regulated membrane protein 10 [Penicillium oxalicum]